MIKGSLSKESGSRTITRVADFVLRHDELAATLIIAVHLYVDWYLGLAFVAQILALALLFIGYRSAQRPWVKPRALWLWILFLVLAIFPATHGLYLRDSAYYYFNVIFNALLMYWLGLVIAQDAASVRRLFKMLSIFTALLAIHTIIEARTGVLLFKSTRYDAILQTLLHFRLGNTSVYRAEGFLLNPDTNGTFFTTMLFLPIGLFVESASVKGKIFYAVEILLILFALHVTYSTGAWIAAFVGIVVFTVLVGRNLYRILIPVAILVAAIVAIMLFPRQVSLQIQHIRTPYELSIRFAAWQTALQVIRAFPLMGLGLGRYVYIKRAEPYRVPEQFIPLDHPHNAYLELAALGGIPMALVFIALLLFAVWLALRNWLRADMHVRPLIACGIAAITALSFNSLAAAGWTGAPMTAIGWLILGAISSSFIVKDQKQEAIHQEVEISKEDSQESQATSAECRRLEIRLAVSRLERSPACHPEPKQGHPEPKQGHPEPKQGHPEPKQCHPERSEGSVPRRARSFAALRMTGLLSKCLSRVSEG